MKPMTPERAGNELAKVLRLAAQKEEQLRDVTKERKGRDVWLRVEANSDSVNGCRVASVTLHLREARALALLLSALVEAAP